MTECMAEGLGFQPRAEDRAWVSDRRPSSTKVMIRLLCVKRREDAGVVEPDARTDADAG
jgi:hypothetical protein